MAWGQLQLKGKPVRWTATFKGLAHERYLWKEQAKLSVIRPNVNAHVCFPVQELSTRNTFRNTTMFAECIVAAVLHKYHLKPKEEVRTTDATVRLCFDMASMAALCQHERFSPGLMP